MRTDVKIGIVLGLLVVAGIVVYFSVNPDDESTDPQTAKTPPADPEVKPPLFGSIASRTPEEPTAPADATDSRVTEPRTPPVEPTVPTDPTVPTTPGEPSIPPGETTPPEPADTRDSGRATITVGSGPADTETEPVRPLFEEVARKPAETTPPGERLAARTPEAPGPVEPPADATREPGVLPRPGEIVPVTPGETEPVVIGGTRRYMVQPGDKLWNIAEKLYGKGHLWTLISEANPGIDPSNLKVRSMLTIPPPPAPRRPADTRPDDAPLTPGYQRYTVQKGEGFWKIAAKFYGNGALWTVIAEANPTLNPTAIREGRSIVIPPKPSPRIRITDVTTEPVEVRPGYRSYQVKSGDILSKVSEKMYGSHKHWLRILDANPGVDPRNLKVGSTLAIPPLSGASVPRTVTRWPTPIEPEVAVRPRPTRTRPRAGDTVPPGRPDFGP